MNNTIVMVGPSISDPSKIVEREVPLADVEAYKRAGYTEMKMFPTLGITYSDADATAQAEVVEVAPVDNPFAGHEEFETIAADNNQVIEVLPEVVMPKRKRKAK